MSVVIENNEIDLDEEACFNKTKMSVVDIIALADTSSDDESSSDSDNVIHECVEYVFKKLDPDDNGKNDVQSIVSIIRDTFALMNQNKELFISQIISTAMGLIRHVLSDYRIRIPQITPGGLIYDDVGSGKTLKMLLIMMAIHIYNRRMRDDGGFCMVICKDAIMSTWEKQGREYFVRSVVQKIDFKDCPDVRKPIVVVSFMNFSRDQKKWYKKLFRREESVFMPKFMVLKPDLNILSIVIDEAHNVACESSDNSNRNSFIRSKLRSKSAWFLTGTSVNNGQDVSERLAAILQDITNFKTEENISNYTYNVKNMHDVTDISPMILDVECAPIELMMNDHLESSITAKDRAAGHQTLAHYYFLQWKMFNIYDDPACELRVTSDSSTLSKTAIGKKRKMTLEVTNSDLLATGHVVRGEPSRLIYVGPYIHKMLYDGSVGIVSVLHDNPTDKIIIFTDYKDEINLLIDVCECLFRGQFVSISGENSASDKEYAIDRFTKNRNTRIILVNKKVGDAGLNLQAGNWVYMLTHETNAATLKQCLGRSARMGQTKNVTWISMVGSTRPEATALTKQKNTIMNDNEDEMKNIIERQNWDLITINKELKMVQSS